MDRFLRKINDLSNNANVGNKLLHNTDLELNKLYRVTGCRSANTTYGRKLIVELDSRFDYFLPSRISKSCSLIEMTTAAKTGRFYMKFKGTSAGGKGDARFDVALFDFVFKENKMFVAKTKRDEDALMSCENADDGDDDEGEDVDDD